MPKFKIKKQADFVSANYHGFTVKNGMWYGNSEDGIPVATSGWCNAGAVSLYILTDGEWNLSWVYPEDIEVDPANIPATDFDSKMSFNQWLEEVEGVTWAYFDNNHGTTEQVYAQYEDYLWDNLPLFLRR